MDKMNRKLAVPPLPPSGGLRRSKRLGNVPPPPPSREGGSNSASERKLPRRQEDGGGRPRHQVEDDVNVGLQVSPREVVACGAGVERPEDESSASGQLTLSRPQPVALGNESSRSEVGGSIGKLGESSSSVSSLVFAAAAAGRSASNSSETSVKEGRAHPCLLIDNVLEVIFKHVISKPGVMARNGISKDVRNIRLVCKTWKTLMTRLYRQTRPEICFDRYDQRSKPGPGEKKPLTQFMKTMEASPMIPVQKYSFYGASFLRKNLKMFREFLLLCGPGMVELKMLIGSSDAERILSNLDNFPTLELNKLKVLGFVLHEDHQRQCQDLSEGLLKLLELFMIAGKTLQKMDVTYHSYPYSEEDDSEPYQRQRDLAAQQICLVIAKRMPRTVKQLKLKMRMNETAFNALAEMQAKLERVYLDIHHVESLGSSAMYKFLQSRAATLKDLEFWQHYDNSRFPVEFPQLDELANLMLPDVAVTLTATSHFAETFPKLHSLKISSQNALSTLLSTVRKPSGSLKVFDLENWRFTCPPPIIQKVARSFPCLAELRICLQREHRETMEEIFKCLDSLESLHLSFFEFDKCASWVDSIFSGISEADCNRIRSHRDFGTVSVNELRRQPSLVNLKNLRKLVVDQHRVNRRMLFTDVSAHFVFLEMDNLREIKLNRLAVHYFSPRYLELLREQLVLDGPYYA